MVFRLFTRSLGRCFVHIVYIVHVQVEPILKRLNCEIYSNADMEKDSGHLCMY